MYKSNYCLFLAVVATLFVLGCAPSIKKVDKDLVLPEIDVVQVKEYSEEALKLSQEAKMDVQMANTRISDVDSKFLTLSEEVSSISIAKIEELETRLALLTEAFKDLHEQMAAIEVLPQIRIAKPKTTKPPLFSTSTPGVLLTSSEYDEYQEALRTFDAHSYNKARTLFLEILNKYPTGEYADKAQYWIGESYYAEGDYANSISSFSKVFKYSNSSKADDAQLKIAISYLRMGKNDLAVEEFKRLINRYPDSEYIPRAQKYLNEMKSQ